MANLVAVSDQSFQAEVLEAQQPTLVDFWAEWCGPCRMMASTLEQLAQEQAGKLRVVQIDVQNNPDTAARYAVLNLPTLILFVGGEPKERLSGYVPNKKIVSKIAPYLG